MQLNSSIIIGLAGSIVLSIYGTNYIITEISKANWTLCLSTIGTFIELIGIFWGFGKFNAADK